MNTPVIIGIDPGKSGAVAAISADDGALVWVEDMPTVEGEVSAALLADLLGAEGITAAAVERVGAMPKQGVSSTFTFGKGYGVVLGVLGGLRVPVAHYSPGTWKRAVGLSSNKKLSRTRAIDTWPAHSHLFRLVKHDGRAEAALLAHHHRTRMQGASAA